MSNVVKNYSKLNHRNNKKDEPHLNKHAMHLIRLLITGTEVLEGKGINTYREKEREFLLDIRKGNTLTTSCLKWLMSMNADSDWQQKTLLFPINPIISV